MRVVHGSVQDEKGKPIKGAAVEWGHFRANRANREVTRTDDDGKFKFETRKVGPDFRLGVSAAGFAPSWRDGLIPRLKQNDGIKVTEVGFKLSRPQTLRGVVVDEHGEPIEGVTVIARSPSSGFYSSFSRPTPSYPFPGPPREGRTDSSGAFVIRNLPVTMRIVDPKNKEPEQGCPYQVAIKTLTGEMPRGRAFSEGDNRIEIRRSYVLEDEELRGIVRCRVVDSQTNEPVPEFRVVRRHAPRMLSFKDQDGEFVIQCDSRGRKYQFFVYAIGYEPAMIRIVAGDPKRVFASEIQLSPRKALRGRVVDSDGQPIANADVVTGISDAKGDRFWWGSFDDYVDGHMGLDFVQRYKTTSDGWFQVCTRETSCVLAIMAPGFARRYVSVSDKEQMMKEGVLVVQLQPQSSLKGTVLLNGKPESQASIRLSKVNEWNMDFGEFRADADGRYVIDGLAPGEYSLAVYQQSGNLGTVRLSRRVVLALDETKELSMDNPGGECTLAGTAAPFSLVNASPIDINDETVYRNVGTIATPEGEYRINGLVKGKYKVTVQVPSALSGFTGRRSAEDVDVSGETRYDPRNHAAVILQRP